MARGGECGTGALGALRTRNFSAVPLELELRQLVLAHQLENFLDVV